MMIDGYGLVQLLTSAGEPAADQARYAMDFAVEMGWRPSDRLELQAANEFSNSNLIVEHGLENTALISFLRHPYRNATLNISQQKVLLNASYNNLVDWHINIDFDGISFIYNRYRPPDFHVVEQRISRSDTTKLKSSFFQSVSSKHPPPDVPSLDSALISTVSLWKRRLASELPGISNSNLSALFNVIIFLRAAEDNARRKGNKEPAELLINLVRSCPPGEMVLLSVLEGATRAVGLSEIPSSIVDKAELSAFIGLDELTVTELISDFYRNRYARYFDYDFSLMSKHALSRIYEHYVSLLRLPYSPQISLFPKLPEERLERSYGNVYTPEFVARFFARYLRKELSLKSFQRLKAADPACGSGIFLRVLLELQSEILFNERTTESLRRLFDGVLGMDVDLNACHASRLSLSLLSLVLTDELPQHLRIVHEETIKYYADHPEIRGSFDAVVANPPFVNLEQQSPALRSQVAEILGQHAQGRHDLYLAIIKIAMSLLKPQGFGMFVLPENFLKSRNASRLRDALSEQCWIRCLVDLRVAATITSICGSDIDH